MSRINLTGSRTSTLLLSDHFLGSLRKTQSSLLTAQAQISSGLKVAKPSDAPQSTSAVLWLQGALEARAQRQNNLTFAGAVLDNVDAAMADASNLVLEAKSIGSSQIGIGSSSDTRKNQALIIDAQIKAMLDITNRQAQGVSLFGGTTTLGGAGSNQGVFAEFLGGIRYVGSTTNLKTDVGLDQPMALNSNGSDAFGALSARVKGDADLNPQATAATHLADLDGAQGMGVRKGTIQIDVDGTIVNIDLSSADTLADVITRVNSAISGIDPAAGSLGLSGGGLALTADLGHTIAIADIGTSQTAADLGITLSATDGTQAGDDLNPRLTALTALASLGASVDLASGLKITQGSTTKVADFSSAATIQDMINIVDQLNLGVKMEINQAGTGLNLISQVSGLGLSIGEVSGGSTATDLGVRTYANSTALTDLNYGLGIHTEAGAPDFSVTLHDGSRVEVNLDGVTDIGGVVDAVRTAAQSLLGPGSIGAIGDAGTLFNVGLAGDGNGLVFEDNTVGASDFQIANVGISLAASDLGIAGNVQAGSSISGADVARVCVESVFTHLINLRDSLASDDTRGITLATSALETDTETLARVHADVGVRAQRVQQQKDRSEDLKIMEKSMLSDLQDADLAEVITRFAQLQQQLEATLQVGSQNLQLSLLDFLR
ncbi:MAG: flagellin [Phycisphaeraceae bacterium]